MKRCALLVGSDVGWQEYAVVRHHVQCAPCYSFTHCPLGHNRCMIDIPEDEVFAQCKRVLDKAGCLCK